MGNTWATPEDLLQPTLDLLLSAEQTIRMSIVGPAPEQVLRLLVIKAQAGLDVQLLLEHSSVSGRRVMAFQRERLKDAGVQFLAATAETVGKELLKNGYLVVDGKYVLAGHHTFGSEPQAFGWLALEHDPVEAARLHEEFLSTHSFIRSMN